jgi:hypothetical protein
VHPRQELQCRRSDKQRRDCLGIAAGSSAAALIETASGGGIFIRVVVALILLACMRVSLKTVALRVGCPISEGL